MATKLISKARDRATLPERRSPYWQSVKKGYQIGCRKLNGGEYWLARSYIGGGKYEQRPLEGVENWEQAIQASRQFFDHVERGGEVSRDTVAQAFEDYVKEVAASTTHSTVRKSLGDLGAIDINNPKLGLYLSNWLKSDAVQKKHTKLRQTEEQRSPATIKRMTTILKAALNMSKARIVSTDWVERLVVADVEKVQRELYLTPDQRRQLIENADKDAKAFIRLLCLMPLRPGDWHHLTVAKFNRHQRSLTVSSKGNTRTLPLSSAAFDLVSEQAKDKLPSAPLFLRSNGQMWDSQSWNEDIKQAAKRSDLPAEVCAYTIRHSVITDLVTAGLDLLQVAKLAGTSLKMIDEHYGKHQTERQTAVLEKIAI
jgi:site-specific recombinase XerD